MLQVATLDAAGTPSPRTVRQPRDLASKECFSTAAIHSSEQAVKILVAEYGGPLLRLDGDGREIGRDRNSIPCDAACFSHDSLEVYAASGRVLRALRADDAGLAESYRVELPVECEGRVETIAPCGTRSVVCGGSFGLLRVTWTDGGKSSTKQSMSRDWARHASTDSLGRVLLATFDDGSMRVLSVEGRPDGGSVTIRESGRLSLPATSEAQLAHMAALLPDGRMAIACKPDRGVCLIPVAMPAR